MDVRMDGMDGFEATRWIVATMPEVAVILYTAHGERGSLGLHRPQHAVEQRGGIVVVSR